MKQFNNLHHLAKISKTVYDGRVRKIFVGGLLFLLLFICGSYFSDKANAAGCKLTSDPQSIDANYSQNLTITSPDSCFAQEKYNVVFYPLTYGDINTALKNKKNESGFVWSPATYQMDVSRQDQDSKTLIVSLADQRLASLVKSLGEKGYVDWRFSVCLTTMFNFENNFINGGTSQCEDENYLTGQGIVSIVPPSPTPTPTPSANQPIIDNSSQSVCTYAAGEDGTILVKNIIPDGNYKWWWDGSRTDNTFKASLGKNVYPSWGYAYTYDDSTGQLGGVLTDLKINGSKISSDLGDGITDPKGHLFCIDLSNSSRKSVNCIWLFFKPAPPRSLGIDPACNETNSIAGKIALSQDTNPIPQPPCIQWGGWNGTEYVPISSSDVKKYFDSRGQLLPGNYQTVDCMTVGTAIGNIGTDPQGLVRTIFNVVLGLSGGIALILIMLSGYQFMASGGNPEKTKAATERLTAAIIGLLFIIFSFVILQIVGVDILRIPGFQP